MSSIQQTLNKNATNNYTKYKKHVKHKIGNETKMITEQFNVSERVEF